MGRFADSEWYLKSSKKLLKQYGDIPPPWVYALNAHPYSMEWRMGGGETHLMLLDEWLDQKALSFDERITFLQKYPNPPRWYQWIIQFLWNINLYELEETDYTEYFEELKKLGFEHTADFQKDFDREDLD